MMERKRREEMGNEGPFYTAQWFNVYFSQM
jgi:hypothetical protein